MWGTILTELFSINFFSINSLQYLFSYDDAVVKKIEQNIPNWLTKINRTKQTIIFYENYFIEYNSYKDKLDDLKKSEISLLYELNKLHTFYSNNINTRIISIVDLKNDVDYLNKNLFEIQKQIEYYQNLLLSKDKQKRMLNHDKQLLNFFYQNYFEDLQCISTYYDKPGHTKTFEKVYNIRCFYFDNSTTINFLSLTTLFGLCYLKYYYI